MTPIYIREKNLMLRHQQHHCFNKKQDMHLIKLFLTLKQERVLILFLGLGNKNIMILWVVLLYIFPKSRFVNSKPGSLILLVHSLCGLYILIFNRYNVYYFNIQ